MDLTEMLSQLMADCKMTLDDQISSVEATRCIERAVNDMSRSIPRERIYEHTWIQDVTDDSFTTPAAGDSDSIVDAADISAIHDKDILTQASFFLDVPRPLLLTLTDANNTIKNMTVVIKGTDADGAYREERFYRHNGKVQTGKTMFSSVVEVVVEEIEGNAAADVLDIGTNEPNLATGGVWIQLSNPVWPDTLSIYSAAGKTGTKYVEDTDYEVDYANGRVRMIYGGSLAAATTYYANYERHHLNLDISSILPELVRIIKVLYPAGKVPEQSVAFKLWENMLTIGSQRTGESQKELVDKEHIAIHYETWHTPPTLSGPGSYPEYLDEIVLRGAGGYVYLVEALQYQLAAVTDLTSMRSELENTTAAYTTMNAAIVKMTKYLENNSEEDAVGILMDITDNIANLRTAMTTAWDAAAAMLGEVSTLDLDKATSGAEDLLDNVTTATINSLQDGGPDVPEKHAAISQTRAAFGNIRISTAQMYLSEANARLNDIMAMIQESAGYIAVVQQFHNEVMASQTQINSYLAEASQYSDAVANNMLLSDRFRAEGNNRLTEFRELLKSRAEYRRNVVDIPARQPA